VHHRGRPYRLLAVVNLGSLSPEDYGGNPALKLPVLKTDSGSVFGAETSVARLPAGVR
jgi:hypothetical protein